MTDTRIRYRPDGSIDTGFYMARGRVLRARAAHRMVTPRARPTGL